LKTFEQLLKELPIVTVEQVLFFRDKSISIIKELELQNGLLKIELENKARLLNSCETALRERDGL